MKRLKFHRHPGLISSQETIKLIPYLKIQSKSKLVLFRLLLIFNKSGAYFFIKKMSGNKWEYLGISGN